jgi:hypothetical protein
MAKMKTKFKSCGWAPVEWSKEQKENVVLFLWIERILTAGASAWGRRGVDEEVVAKRRPSGEDVVEEFDEDDDMREDGKEGSVVDSWW